MNEVVDIGTGIDIIVKGIEDENDPSMEDAKDIEKAANTLRCKRKPSENPVPAGNKDSISSESLSKLPHFGTSTKPMESNANTPADLQSKEKTSKSASTSQDQISRASMSQDQISRASTSQDHISRGSSESTQVSVKSQMKHLKLRRRIPNTKAFVARVKHVLRRTKNRNHKTSNIKQRVKASKQPDPHPSNENSLKKTSKIMKSA
ncbi:hypothetical protein OESDEN_17500, partial [Oesophagostomum dentatum]